MCATYMDIIIPRAPDRDNKQSEVNICTPSTIYFSTNLRSLSFDLAVSCFSL